MGQSEWGWTDGPGSWLPRAAGPREEALWTLGGLSGQRLPDPSRAPFKGHLCRCPEAGGSGPQEKVTRSSLLCVPGSRHPLGHAYH